MVVQAELGRYKKFRNALSSEDKAIFEDMLNQCKLYASAASTLASPLKEVPLIISMLFAQQKKIVELEKTLGGSKSMLRYPYFIRQKRWDVPLSGDRF